MASQKNEGHAAAADALRLLGALEEDEEGEKMEDNGVVDAGLAVQVE